MAGIPETYSKLCGFINDENFSAASEAADVILEQDTDAEDVMRTKVLCLIHMNKAQEALNKIEEFSAIDLSMERAYVLYSLNRSADALKALSQLQEKPTVALHLEAQTRYRMGEYDAVTRIYEELRTSGEEGPDFSANLLAAYASSSTPGKAPLEDLSPDTFEGMYNGALTQQATGNLEEASATLEAAYKMGLEQLELDDYEPEEIKDELAVIDVQRAYLEQLKGNVDGAIQSYTEVMQAKPTDAAVVAVARNNMVACKGEKDLFDAFKHMRAAHASNLDRRLNLTQRQVIATNNALVLLLMGKNKEAREEIAAHAAKFPTSEQSALLSAALAHRQKRPAAVEKVLKEYIKKSGGGDNKAGRVQACLTLAQHYMNEKNLKAAAETLASIKPLQHQPAMVATLVAIYGQLMERERAVGVLDEAIKFWKKSKGADGGVLSILLKESAAYKLKCGMEKEALKAYAELVATNSGDHEAVAAAIVASARIDPQLAKKYQAMLPPLTSADGLDGEELEAAAAPRLGRASKATRGEDEDAEAAAAALAAARKAKKKKKHKIRYPKNYNPDRPQPLPAHHDERWLPKWQRSTAKKTRKKRNAKEFSGGQGGISTREMKVLERLDKSDKKGSSLDATTGSARVKGAPKAEPIPEDPEPEPEVKAPPAQNKKKSGKKKKKK